MRLLFTTVILALLAQPVWAKTVYYCVNPNVVTIENGSIEQYEAPRFKMAFDEKQLKFSENFLGIKQMEVEWLRSDGSFAAKTISPASEKFVNQSAIAILAPSKIFYYSEIDRWGVLNLTAKCEKF